MEEKSCPSEDHSTSIGSLGKFLVHLSPSNEVKAFDNFRILRGIVGRLLESRGMPFERCPWWRRLSWIFFPSCSKMHMLVLPWMVAFTSKIQGLPRRMLPTSIGMMSH